MLNRYMDRQTLGKLNGASQRLRSKAEEKGKMTTTIKILPTPLEILEAAYVVCGVLMEKRQATIMLCSLTFPKAGVREI